LHFAPQKSLKSPSNYPQNSLKLPSNFPQIPLKTPSIIPQINPNMPLNLIEQALNDFKEILKKLDYFI
jgi:hypothetical protein